MRVFLAVVIATFFLGIGGTAALGPQDCLREMARIDRALETYPETAAQEYLEATVLRREGEAFHDQGLHFRALRRFLLAKKKLHLSEG